MMMVARGRSPRVTSHRGFRSWVADAAVALRGQAGRFTPLTRNIEVRIELIGFSYRGDIDNVAKAAVDALEKSGIIQNDNRVEKLTVERRPKDKSGARTIYHVKGE